MTDMIGDRSITILKRCVTFGAFGHGVAGRCCIILNGDFGSVMIGHGRIVSWIVRASTILGPGDVDDVGRWRDRDRSGCHSGLDPGDRSDTDLGLLGGSINAGSLAEEPFDGLDLGRVERGSSRFFGASGQTSHDTTAGHFAFKISEDAEHTKHGTAAGRRGVERLLMKIQVHALRVDLDQEADEVLEGASEPINCPGGDHVDLATGNHLHQGVEAGALITAFRTRDALVGIFHDNVPSIALGDGEELTALVLSGLGVLRDPGVNCDALAHRANSNRSGCHHGRPRRWKPGWNMIRPGLHGAITFPGNAGPQCDRQGR